MTKLNLPAAMRGDIIEHAMAEAPRECCGIIAGKNGAATTLYRMENTDPGTEFYLMDDEELYKVVREIEDRDEDILVIYHSHPVSRPYPSKTDVELAFWEESYYLIASLRDPANPEMRAYRISDGNIEETPIDYA